MSKAIRNVGDVVLMLYARAVVRGRDRGVVSARSVEIHGADLHLRLDLVGAGDEA